MSLNDAKHLLETYYEENEEGILGYKEDEQGCAEDCIYFVSRVKDTLEANEKTIANQHDKIKFLEDNELVNNERLEKLEKSCKYFKEHLQNVKNSNEQIVKDVKNSNEQIVKDAKKMFTVLRSDVKDIRDTADTVIKKAQHVIENCTCKVYLKRKKIKTESS